MNINIPTPLTALISKNIIAKVKLLSDDKIYSWNIIQKDSTLPTVYYYVRIWQGKDKYKKLGLELNFYNDDIEYNFYKNNSEF